MQRDVNLQEEELLLHYASTCSTHKQITQITFRRYVYAYIYIYIYIYEMYRVYV